MADCEMLATCIFFNERMASMPATAGLLKSRFCEGTWEACARYRVCKGLGREKVPKDLFPNQADVADRLLH